MHNIFVQERLKILHFPLVKSLIIDYYVNREMAQNYKCNSSYAIDNKIISKMPRAFKKRQSKLSARGLTLFPLDTKVVLYSSYNLLPLCIHCEPYCVEKNL